MFIFSNNKTNILLKKNGTVFTLYRFFLAVSSAFLFNIFLQEENKGGKNKDRPQDTD